MMAANRIDKHISQKKENASSFLQLTRLAGRVRKGITLRHPHYVGNDIISWYKNSPPLEGCPQGRGGRVDEWDKSPVPL